MSLEAISGIRRQPGYLRFISAATLARVAHEMLPVGVVLLVLERTGSGTIAGATIAAVTLPSLVSGPLLGAWLDITGRRRLIMALDQVGISATLLLILLLAGHAPDALLPVAGLVAGITWPLSFGGFSSLIPTLVPDRLMHQANAFEVSSYNLALIAGPALAGTLSAAVSPEAPLIAEICLTLAALCLILATPTLDALRGMGRKGRSVPAVAAAGLRLLWSVAELRAVMATGMLSLAGIGLLTVAFPFFAVEHLGADRAAAGYLWAAFAIGSMAGALTLVRLQHGRSPETIVIRGVAVFGALMLLWPIQADLVPMLLVVAAAGVADGPALAATFATRQRHVPMELLGQVFTTGAGLKVGAFSLGSALAGPLVLAAGSSGALVAAALVQFAAAGLGLALMRTASLGPVPPGVRVSDEFP